MSRLPTWRHDIRQVADSGQALVVQDISKEPVLQQQWMQENLTEARGSCKMHDVLGIISANCTGLALASEGLKHPHCRNLFASNSLRL
jgi:hypothetical protein